MITLREGLGDLFTKVQNEAVSWGRMGALTLLDTLSPAM